MKLLFDENLSPRLLELLAADFPDSTHIEHLKMRGATDAVTWPCAIPRSHLVSAVHAGTKSTGSLRS